MYTRVPERGPGRTTALLPRLLRVAIVLSALAMLALLVRNASTLISLRRERTLGNVESPTLGSRLPDISLVQVAADTAPIGHRGTPLSSITGAAGCSVLIFFESSCPACEALAPSWRGVHVLGLGHVPVTWVTIHKADTGAKSFLERHGLPRPAYAISGRADRMMIGALFWPNIYVVDSANGLLAQIPGAVPDSVPVPSRCGPGPGP